MQTIMYTISKPLEAHASLGWFMTKARTLFDGAHNWMN